MTDASIYFREDTIAALSTPPGPGAIAVVRLSGPQAVELCKTLFHPRVKSALDTPRRMAHGLIVDPQSNEVIDDAMCVIFTAPRSYTGEDMAEIHSHGSEAVVRRLLDLLYRSGARAAEPGEFTFRAVRSGKLDLAQAEAVGHLIESRSQLARSMSLRMLEGAFSDELSRLKNAVTQAVVEMETQIEFPDDALEEALNRDLQHHTGKLMQMVETLQRRAVREQRFDQGVVVVLAGRPNVGKSSLFNRLLGRERAIVTPHAGTTRDSLEGTLELAGWPVTLIDTAGLRETQEEIEAIGIQRSRDLLAGSQLVLFICDASQPLGQEDRHWLAELRSLVEPARMILLANKADLPMADNVLTDLRQTAPSAKALPVSAVSESGVFELLRVLEDAVRSLAPPEAESAFLVSARQEAVLFRMAETVARCRDYARQSAPLELMAEELRAVLRDIAELDGSGVTPDIMNTIFSQFCIGK